MAVKLNIQKSKIMASSPLTLWQIDGETMETVKRLYFLGLPNHCRWWLQLWNQKTLALWKKSYDQPRQHIKKQRCYFANKGPLVKAMLFPVVMYGYESWTIKKAENWRIDAFWTAVLEKTLEGPLDCEEIKPVILMEISTEYSLEGLILKLQYFGHLIRRTDSLEKTLMLGKTEGRRRRGQHRMRWLDVSPTWWTWVWASFGSWWWTGKPGVVQSMELETVRYDWATELTNILKAIMKNN